MTLDLDDSACATIAVELFGYQLIIAALCDTAVVVGADVGGNGERQ